MIITFNLKRLELLKSFFCYLLLKFQQKKYLKVGNCKRSRIDSTDSIFPTFEQLNIIEYSLI